MKIEVRSETWKIFLDTSGGLYVYSDRGFNLKGGLKFWWVLDKNHVLPGVVEKGSQWCMLKLIMILFKYIMMDI